MTDLIISEEDYKNGKVKKAIQKGARLHLYPVGMQIVRHSRGIKEPEPEWMEEKEAEEATAGMSETYRKIVHIQSDDGLDMYVETVYYNRIRKDWNQIGGKIINEIS